jgi:hypothetical protein
VGNPPIQTMRPDPGNRSDRNILCIVYMFFA